MPGRGAWFARKLNGGLMRLQVKRQRVVTYSEIKQIFGCCFPDEVWTLLANIPEGPTRGEVIEGLQAIANRNRRARAASQSQQKTCVYSFTERSVRYPSNGSVCSLGRTPGGRRGRDPELIAGWL